MSGTDKEGKCTLSTDNEGLYRKLLVYNESKQKISKGNTLCIVKEGKHTLRYDIERQHMAGTGKRESFFVKV
jgi:hypothetical protein